MATGNEFVPKARNSDGMAGRPSSSDYKAHAEALNKLLKDKVGSNDGEVGSHYLES